MRGALATIDENAGHIEQGLARLKQKPGAWQTPEDIVSEESEVFWPGYFKGLQGALMPLNAL